MSEQPIGQKKPSVSFARVYRAFFLDGKGSFDEKSKTELGLTSSRIAGIRAVSFFLAIVSGILAAILFPDIPSISAKWSFLIKVMGVWVFSQPLFATLGYFISDEEY
jgi:hypothetical protein